MVRGNDLLKVIMGNRMGASTSHGERELLDFRVTTGIFIAIGKGNNVL